MAAIRQANPGDLSFLRWLQNRPSSRDAGYVHPAAMLERIERGEVLLAEVNDQPAAYVIVSRRADRLANIPQIVVTEELWRNGIGEQLMTAAIAQARRNNARAMVLKTAYGAAANLFWPQLHFTPVATMAGQRRPLLAWCLPLAEPGLHLPPPSRRRSHVLTWKWPTQSQQVPAVHRPW